jgi:hypothetical protein
MADYNRADRENKLVLRWKVGGLDGWKIGWLRALGAGQPTNLPAFQSSIYLTDLD